ncbi:hypothetical protein KC330_g39 [Hortaea werneckii]|nr:hypothetical protein KC330_g39 [Hortaea werneckii]
MSRRIAARIDHDASLVKPVSRREVVFEERERSYLWERTDLNAGDESNAHHIHLLEIGKVNAPTDAEIWVLSIFLQVSCAIAVLFEVPIAHVEPHGVAEFVSHRHGRHCDGHIIVCHRSLARGPCTIFRNLTGVENNTGPNAQKKNCPARSLAMDDAYVRHRRWRFCIPAISFSLSGIGAALPPDIREQSVIAQMKMFNAAIL